MMKLTSTEFARNFGLHRENVQLGPIAITAHARITGYFISRRDFEEYLRIKSLHQPQDGERRPSDH
ncbi:hypothetical protein WAE61_04220 [Comamonadaceae bacterium PP-2]